MRFGVWAPTSRGVIKQASRAAIAAAARGGELGSEIDPTVFGKETTEPFRNVRGRAD